ncbi:MAG: Blue-light-activated protein [Syntrophus sp. PtaB.Bin075]|nr:MAG: Blue-light-activated protein [Syntrophus sp. PtaB.Bin075]
MNDFRVAAGSGKRRLLNHREPDENLPLSNAGKSESVPETSPECDFRDDVLQHGQAEDALRNSDALYSTFFETTQSIVLILTSDARILACSSAAEKLLGCNKEQIIGKSYVDLFVPKKDQTKSRKAILNILKGRDCRNVETEVLVRNSVIRTILWNATRLPGRATRPHGIIAFGQDITERKRMENELLRAQKLEAVGILAGGLAHDFNNLIAAILGNISLVKAGLNPEEKNCIRLIRAEQSCLQARELTNRLITFSDGGKPRRHITSLTSFLQKMVFFTPQSASVLCRYRLPKNLYSVRIDENQIQQVFLHLLRNAEEAMPDGGEIVIEAENFCAASDLPPGLKKGRYVRCSVRDHGKGIAPEFQSRIFEPYYTSKPKGAEKGSGLGLAICYSIIRKHGGTITFSSESGQGTMFSFYLPAVPEDSATVATGRPSLQTMKERILLMDDEEAVRNITSQLLTHLGYEVELAGNGEEAITRFGQAESAGRPFSQVMLDLTIRGGMGGFKTLQKLREINPEVRAIIVSGYTNDPIVEFFDEHGFNASLTKPFTIKQLQTALANSGA